MPQLFIILICIIGFIGYVLNIIKLLALEIDAVSTILILRVLGIFIVPLGTILGFIPN